MENKSTIQDTSTKIFQNFLSTLDISNKVVKYKIIREKYYENKKNTLNNEFLKTFEP